MEVHFLTHRQYSVRPLERLVGEHCVEKHWLCGQC